MEYLYKRSFEELESVFRIDFKKSPNFNQMVIDLHENLIEYKFLHVANII